jgi:hypothetical protein
LAVPARSSVRLRFELEVRKPGTFEQIMPLYVDDAGLRSLALTVRGVGVAATGKDK